MKYTNLLPTLLLLPMLATSALAQSAGQSVKVVKGVVSKVENVEMDTADNSGGGAVVGGAVAYNLGSGRSQTQKRRAAIVGAGVGAAAAAPGKTLGVRYTVAVADGSSVAVLSSEVLTIEPGSCVSVEQSTDRSTIRKVDQAVCDLEKQTTVSVSSQQSAGESDKCQVAQQQLLDAKTAEQVELANSKIKILCE